MKKSAAVILVLLLFAGSLSATPLTWVIMGTTSAGSQFNGNSIVGLPFEIQISIDTNQVGTQFLADGSFVGPHPAEIDIQGLGIEPMNNFNNVGYFLGTPNHDQVTGVELNGPSFNQLLFSSAISNDILHLFPISPITPDPQFNHLSMLTGPNGLLVFGTVDTFSAVETAAPENSTATMLICVFIAVGALRLARRLALVRALIPQVRAYHDR